MHVKKNRVITTGFKKSLKAMSEILSHALIVDDKTAPHDWAHKVLEMIGFAPENIHHCFYGDHGLSTYRKLIEDECPVDIVVSDFHMDVRRKPPEGNKISTKGAKIFSGIELAREIFTINPHQKFCLVSSGLDHEILEAAHNADINLVLYKRRPEDKKFPAYVEQIRGYVDGTLDLADPAKLNATHFLVPKQLVPAQMQRQAAQHDVP